MKNICTLLFLFFTLYSQGQHSISGSFSPAKNYRWLIAYQLKSGGQNYIADTAVKNGNFKINLKENSPTGTYRMVYGTPQEEFYFDIIYNGKEDIKLTFDYENGVSFISSEENITLSEYFKEISICEQEIAAFYGSKKTDKAELSQLTQSLKEIQANYEAKSTNLICRNYIIANSPYIPSATETVQEYVANKKSSYFKNIDFTNSILQNSDFLTDKTINYVLTAMPLIEVSEDELEAERQKNCDQVNSLLKNIKANYSSYLYYKLWQRLSSDNLNKTSDYVYDNYLKTLAIQTKNKKLINAIEVANRLRIGAVAPEIEWNNGSSPKKLSQLKGAEHYVVVFWSSGCPHCLKELPELHKKLSNNDAVKVLAVGLEDKGITWKEKITVIPEFQHALALGKWQNKYVGIYNFNQTPAYFILDKDKKIVNKPSDYKEALTFLNQ